MMMNMTVEDITHHPKRTQAENILKAGTAFHTITEKGAIEATANSDIPLNVTLESTIKYYRDHADGAFRNLYLFTAEALDKYRLTSKKDRKLAEEAKDVPEFSAEE